MNLLLVTKIQQDMIGMHTFLQSMCWSPRHNLFFASTDLSFKYISFNYFRMAEMKRVNRIIPKIFSIPAAHLLQVSGDEEHELWIFLNGLKWKFTGTMLK